MGDDARERRLHVGVTTNFIAPQWNNLGGKAVDHCRRCKKA
jgi:hypothetical protein